MCEFTTMGRMPFVGNGRECNIKIVRARKKLQLLQLLNQVDLDRASSRQIIFTKGFVPLILAVKL